MQFVSVKGQKISMQSRRMKDSGDIWRSLTGAPTCWRFFTLDTSRVICRAALAVSITTPARLAGVNLEVGVRTHLVTGPQTMCHVIAAGAKVEKRSLSRERVNSCHSHMVHFEDLKGQIWSDSADYRVKISIAVDITACVRLYGRKVERYI